MAVELQPAVSPAPESGQLAVVRGRRWVVADVIRSELPADITSDVPPTRQHLVSLISVEDDATGEELTVIWELEPGASFIDRPDLPDVDADRIDDPRELDAFLDAVRWGAVTSADSRALQAPFRSGIAIEDYQLEPVVRALRIAAHEPPDRRRCGARQDDRGRSGRPGADPAAPGAERDGGLPGLASDPVA